LLSSQLSLDPDFRSYVTLVPVIVMVTMVAVIIPVPAVPIVRPVVAIVRIGPVVAVRIVIAIWVISIIARSDPYSDRNASARTLRGNESQYPGHQSN